MGSIGLFHDLRFALRSLMRQRAFTIVSVLTLTLAIGANTAVFTLVDGVLIRPLPFRDADDLISLQHLGREGADELPMSTGLYLFYREQAKTLESLALYANTTVTMVREGESERLPAEAVTPSFFEVLGVAAAQGRTFVEEEGAPGGEPTVVVSDGFWRSRLGADPGVLGRTLDLNGRLRTIVGVMPPGFGFPDDQAALWAPLVIDPTQAPLAAFGASGIGRLAPGNSIASAMTELGGLIDRLSEFYPESGAPAFLAEVGLRPRILSLKESLVGDVRTTLWILLASVGFVLLIACANVANLLLVRAEGRQRELALRRALGAGRWQVLRWFLSESVLLAGTGGSLGVLLAAWALKVAIRLVPTDIPRLTEVGLDTRVIGFTALVSLGCAVFFGFFPLLRDRSAALVRQLHEGSARLASAGRDRHRLRSGLVVVQVALSLMLLIGSGLMLRSFQALRRIDPGFRTDHLLTAMIIVPGAEIPGWAETADYFRQLRERVAAQPGVQAVGLAQAIPLTGGMSYTTNEIEDHPRAPDELPTFASNNQVASGFIEAMGIPLVEGRTPQPGDGAEGTRSVVVSKSLADHFWPDRSAVGRRLRLGFDNEEWYDIVGVVGDVRYQNLTDPPEEVVYWPATVGPASSPTPSRLMYIVVRTTADPLSFIPVLRREMRELNPRIPAAEVRSMGDLLTAATARTSFTLVMLAVAAAVALLLGLVGIYGVISYIVAQRTREVGIRMALGATDRSVLLLILRQGLLLTFLGVFIGLVAAGALSSVMQSLLYGVAATDPLTYGVLAAAQVAVATLAGWLPARRAAALDPSRALRLE
jgi:putative ABC transport system permease protein